MKLGLFGAIGATLVLSACGGSNTNENVDRVTLDQLKDRVAVAVDTFEFAEDDDGFVDIKPAKFSALPQGSVGYSGVAVVASGIDTGEDFSPPTFAAIGSSTMRVNFGTQVITGSANNFFEVENPETALIDDSFESIMAIQGKRIDGSLTYQFDQTVPLQNQYSGSVAGKLSPLNGEALSVGGTMEGFFTGERGRGFFGYTAEEIIIDGIDAPGVVNTGVGLIMTRNN